MRSTLQSVADGTEVKESFARKGEGFVYACTIRGESHKVKRTSCQDSHLFWTGEEDGHDFFILAVADGHGATRHDLSEHGSVLAVQAAVAQMRSLCRNFGFSNQSLWTNFSLHFPRLLQRQWQRDVIHHATNDNSYSHDNPSAHIEAHPREIDQSQKEQDSASYSYKMEDIARDVQVQQELFVRYGTTLSVALCTSTHLLMGRIGDGETILFHQDSDLNLPFSANDQSKGVFSLCHAEAPLMWEVSCHERSYSDLLLLTTDGLSNSFGNAAGVDAFDRFVRSFQTRINQESVEQVIKDVPSWLNQCSAQGSQDDITLAFVLLKRPEFPREANQTTPPSLREGRKFNPIDDTELSVL